MFPAAKGRSVAKLKEIRDLLVHTIPSGDYSQVVKYLAELDHKRHGYRSQSAEPRSASGNKTKSV